MICGHCGSGYTTTYFKTEVSKTFAYRYEYDTNGNITKKIVNSWNVAGNFPMGNLTTDYYTYGYLGAAYEIPLVMLYGGSYYAAGFPTGSNLEHEITEDWPYVTLGYSAYG